VGLLSPILRFPRGLGTTYTRPSEADMMTPMLVKMRNSSTRSRNGSPYTRHLSQTPANIPMAIAGRAMALVRTTSGVTRPTAASRCWRLKESLSCSS
jgi:hypothetical protein